MAQPQDELGRLAMTEVLPEPNGLERLGPLGASEHLLMPEVKVRSEQLWMLPWWAYVATRPPAAPCLTDLSGLTTAQRLRGAGLFPNGSAGVEPMFHLE
jgi:hypothetical protein